MTFAEGYTWSVDASTEPAADFKEALHIFAGKAAEIFIFPREIRCGSSLDEEEIVKAIASNIKIKTGADFEFVFIAITMATMAILKRHEACLRAIGEHLLASLVLPGAELEALFLKHNVVRDDGNLCLPAHLAADLRAKGLLK
jgi:aminopeptidase-like protein